MKHCFTLMFAFLVTLAGTAQDSHPVELVVKDDALYTIVDKDSEMTRQATGFMFTEGPVWTAWGNLLFSDIPANKIYELKEGSEATIFKEPSGHANGLTFNTNAELIICEHDGQLTKLDKRGNYTVLVSNYEGKRLNSPNDVVLKSDGGIYFTDPPYGLKGQDDSPEKELDFNGVYRFLDDELTLLSKQFTRPNGIAFSPDEKFLYVANSDPADKYWMKFPVKEDGTLDIGTELFRINNPEGPGGPDGLKVDMEGNVYCTDHEGVWIFSPDGKHLGTIRVPEGPTNVAWGGQDLKTLYITARNSVYSIPLKIKGYVPYLNK